MTEMRNLEDFFFEVDDIFHYSELSSAQKREKIDALKLKHSNMFPIKDSDYFYFLGYAGFIARDLGDETEAYFKEALRLDPSNEFCKYYYAYLLFDKKRYEDALRAFEDINLDSFERRKITWMVFKIKEAIACCYLVLANYSERDRIEKIDEFLAEYEKHVMIEENKYNNPVNYPHEMIHLVSESIGKLGDNFLPIVARIVDLMQKEGLATTYSREYLKMRCFLESS